jgi:hypothetical protein
MEDAIGKRKKHFKDPICGMESRLLGGVRRMLTNYKVHLHNYRLAISSHKMRYESKGGMVADVNSDAYWIFPQDFFV